MGTFTTLVVRKVFSLLFVCYILWVWFSFSSCINLGSKQGFYKFKCDWKLKRWEALCNAALRWFSLRVRYILGDKYTTSYLMTDGRDDDTGLQRWMQQPTHPIACRCKRHLWCISTSEWERESSMQKNCNGTEHVVQSHKNCYGIVLKVCMSMWGTFSWLTESSLATFILECLSNTSRVQKSALNLGWSWTGPCRWGWCENSGTYDLWL